MRRSTRARWATAVAVSAVVGTLAPAAGAKTPPGFHDRGILRYANTAAKTISVQDTDGDPSLRGHQVTLSLTRTTRITRDGQAAKISALQAGDAIAATGHLAAHGRLVATQVDATSPPRPDAPAVSAGGQCVYYGSCTPDLPPTTGGPALTITISNFTFDPPVAVVPVGSIVTIHNQDAAPHTFSGNHLDSGALATGASYTVEFTTPGTYRFFCTIHPFMNGVLEVR